MLKIFFATTNEGKVAEARQILGIDVIPTPLEIDEVQSLDPKEVALKKARSYFEKLKKPILVEDVSLKFKALGGLPGTYISDFFKALGNEGLCELVDRERLAVATTTLVYIEGLKKEHIFQGKVCGKIALYPKGEGFGWDPIFIPRGEKRTFGEMTLAEKNRYSMRQKALVKFKKWLTESTKF